MRRGLAGALVGRIGLGDMSRMAVLASTLPIGLGMFAAAATVTAKVRAFGGSSCPVRTSHVIAADSQAELYLALKPPRHSLVAVFGCTYKSKRTYVLGDPAQGMASSRGV